MLTEWSSETGPESPVLEVPWSGDVNGVALRWVDLRDDPDALDDLAEADAWPALVSALRALNGARSPVFTAKCDAWAMDPEELAATRDDLLLDEQTAAAGVACYIDLLWRERTVFASRHHMETMLYRLDRMGTELWHPQAKLEAVLRPALLDIDGAMEGFAVTLYVKGVGADEAEAVERWGNALRDAAALLRTGEFDRL